MKTIMVVGASYKVLNAYLEAAGYTYFVAYDQDRINHAPSERYLPIDFSTPETMLQSIDQQLHGREVDGLIAIYENYIVPASHIAEHLRIPQLPLEAAEACTDKQLMRQKFMAADPSITPAFMLIHDEQELIKFSRQHEYPLILKPTNLVKSLLITKCHTEEELIRHYRKTLSQIQGLYDKYAPNREPQLLVEEFMIGSIHSVDAFVDNAGDPHVLDAVVDYQTGFDIGFDDNFHYSRRLPSRLSDEQVAAIRQCARAGCRALGMKNTAAHIEIILTKSSPKIVEIGARNGGYRPVMHDLSSGINIYEAAIQTALGESVHITSGTPYPVAVLELFPKNPGIYQGIRQLEAVRSLPSFVSITEKVIPGEFVGKSSDGYKMCANLILHHKDAEQFETDLTFVNNEVRVETIPGSD